MTNSPVPFTSLLLARRPPASLLPVYSRRVDVRCSPFSHSAPPRQRGRSWLSRARRVELYWTGFFLLVSHRCMLGERKKKKGEFRPSQRLSATVDPAASTPPKIPAPSLPHRQGSSALDVGSSSSSPAHSFSPHLVLAAQHSCPGRFTTLLSSSALPPLLYPIAWSAPQEELGRFGVSRAASSTLVHPRQLCGQHGPPLSHTRDENYEGAIQSQHL